MSRGIAAFSILALSTAAQAQSQGLSVEAQDLPRALAKLGSAAGVEILVQSNLVRGRKAPVVRRAHSVEQALGILLRDTGLSFRRSAEGVFLIFATPRTGLDPRRSVPVPEGPDIAEILVVGRSTLNVDLRRSADDIQPYQISDGASIRRGQPSGFEDFTRTRLSANTQSVTTSQSSQSSAGSVRSQVNLRGLGTEQTLVLIDGRRLPSIPASGSFLQADLSALPVAGVERVEALPSTAGGIFGLGATGGALNIVMDRDFEASEFGLTQGISDRGDGRKWGLDAKVGLTSASQRSRMLIRVAHSEDDGLVTGDRGFAEATRRQQRARSLFSTVYPVSPSINITSLTGGPLSLRESLGGASLGAVDTFLPIGSPSLTQRGLAILQANAGKLDIMLSPDGQGVQQSLLTPATVTSVIATVRQSVGDRVELFLDGLRLQSVGTAVTPAVRTDGLTSLAAGAPGNPFAQPIRVSYPTPGLLGEARTRTRTERLLGGAIVRLPGNWSASVDYAVGRASFVTTTREAALPIPALSLFDGADAFAQQIADIVVGRRARYEAHNDLRDANIRLAGPVFRLPAGQVSVTLTGESRREGGPGRTSLSFADDGDVANEQQEASQRQKVGSLFAEVRVPVLKDDLPLGPLRSLELQFAFRRDRYAVTVPVSDEVVRDVGLYGDKVTNRGDITSLTAGIKLSPTHGLMLRASFANGATPPSPTNVTPAGFYYPNFVIVDPKRGGAQPFSTDSFLVLFQGTPGLRPMKTDTISAGFVLTPDFIPNVRLSIDYTELRTRREIGSFATFNPQYYIDHEASYSDRVDRGALSSADAAKGYTAGPLEQVDTSYLANGRSVVRAIDAALDFHQPLAGGSVASYAQATWQPDLRRRNSPDDGYTNYVNHLDGPLSWRGNASVEYIGSRWTTGLAAQYYGSYRVTYGNQAAIYNSAINVGLQGRARVPSQAYVDWGATLTSRLNSTGGRNAKLTYRIGIKNLFDTRPPAVFVTTASGIDMIGYSAYGDPRGRRFELQASASF